MSRPFAWAICQKKFMSKRLFDKKNQSYQVPISRGQSRMEMTMTVTVRDCISSLDLTSDDNRD